ncbi:CDP-alcohol phosphatidyltransferase family protein [Pseudorhodobacter sp.]|uniref:CDP-alcohol phosphatidyltransferase family protein n=1 Tax=Pseudorhodobacter sp. TaxID=1934400 RepID=UPI002B002F0A|nr:CDP-alcohol phosphatidyltransferase family protein [Pseudorhodobacter sp.]
MIDAALVPVLRAVLEAPARALVARGIGADQVTLAGFCIGLLALPALWLGWYGLALGLILANRVADGLDGVMARQVGATDRGAFLDIALDFFFYATVPLGFALAEPENALAAAVLICAFVGTGSSFLAFAVIAAKRGLQAGAHRAKGIYYLGGLTEGTETIGVFVLMCLFPAWFVPLAFGFAAACAVTTVLRWLQGWRVFSDL